VESNIREPIDDVADDAPVIHTGSTVRTGKERFDTLQLAFGKITYPPVSWLMDEFLS
jgi:hypothetical protein